MSSRLRGLRCPAARRLNLSARAYGRILRVARTIADLAAGYAVTVHHVSEALLFRQLDADGLDSSHTPADNDR